MALKISRASDSHTNYEYGCDLRRLYPWKGVSDPIFWGAAIASIRAGEATTPHKHDEEETFIIISGEGIIEIDYESETVADGDVVYLPRGSVHTLENRSTSAPLVFLTIFWNSVEAREAMTKYLLENPNV